MYLVLPESHFFFFTIGELKFLLYNVYLSDPKNLIRINKKMNVSKKFNLFFFKLAVSDRLIEILKIT